MYVYMYMYMYNISRTGAGNDRRRSRALSGSYVSGPGALGAAVALCCLAGVLCAMYCMTILYGYTVVYYE